MPTNKRSIKQVRKQPANIDKAAPKMPAKNHSMIRVRLDALFADIKRLSSNPASKTPEIQQELAALRARVAELEKEILEGKETAAQTSMENQASPASAGQVSPNEEIPAITLEGMETAAAETQAASEMDIEENPVTEEKMPVSGPILYEREKIGYVFADNRLKQVRNAAELANINPAISVPLTSSGKPIGKMELTIPAEHEVTPEVTGIVNSVAQQVSQQIESLRLLAETERARAEAEAASRRFMHEGWKSYLDAIHQNERIGFAYDQSAVMPFIKEPELNGGIRETVSVMDEQVGSIYLTPDPEHPLADDDQELLAAVAGQVAQQVENIRLLADAARARAESEETVKRVTRETWKSFTDQKESGSLSYAYDTNSVMPFDQPLPEEPALTLPLQVRGETIGQLAVTGDTAIDPDAAALAADIAAQASAHLENLRLNEELQKRAEELQELDRLKSGFLANMSHELRTPLNSILGFSDVILEELDGPLTPNMSSDLHLIQKNGQHLLHLINDVLDMSKIEAGRMNLDPEKLKVHDILDEVASITSTLASEKNLALFIDPDSDQSVEIVADRTRLRQVMINLVNNAIKFTEKGQIALRVVKKDENNILISVKDTGISIPQDKLEVIFQEFTQVDISSTRKAGGTGLGLPISRRLVEMHGGTLWAESSGVNGEGSTFFISLPMVANISTVVEKKAKLS
jgi:signal transduction histidine kinase